MTKSVVARVEPKRAPKILREDGKQAAASKTRPDASKPAKTKPKQAASSESKQHTLLSLLRRAEGATIEDMMRAADWQQHSVRGFLAGTVKKKLGLDLKSSKSESGSRSYRVAARRGR